MEIQQSMGSYPSCSMLLLYLGLLITVTFSTPTPVLASYFRVPVIGQLSQVGQEPHLYGSFRTRITAQPLEPRLPA